MKDTLIAALKDFYELEVSDLIPLEGYISKNFRVDHPKGRMLIKVYPLEDRILEDVKGENRVLEHLNSKHYPKPIFNKDNRQLTLLKQEGIFIRALSFLEGEFLAKSDYSNKLGLSLGSFLGKMDLELSDFSNVALEARRLSWDIDRLDECEAYLEDIKEAADRKLIHYFLNQWKVFTRSKVAQLRCSIIHNDANDWNVLCDGLEVTGLIDFGDAVYSRTIYNVAIAATYLSLDRTNPIEVTADFVKGYHDVFPLRENEIEVLFNVMAARMCMSLLHSAHAASKKKDTEYIKISERPMWQLLRKWITINPIHATNKWLTTCGFQPMIEDTVIISQKRNQNIPSVLSMSYEKPIHMTKGAFQYMFDAKGNSILDAYNNIIHVGHCHPKVVEAGMKGMATLNTNTRYHYRELTDYVEKLLTYFPDNLNQVFLLNSGSAANDLAIRLARNYTGNRDILVLEHGYHGNTTSGIDISHYKYSGKGGKGRPIETIQTELPDTYRGQYRGEHAGQEYVSELKRKLEKCPDQLAAFIAEPIVGCGGQIPLAKGYLKGAYELIRQRGGLCISDEVQVGFGRLGEWFWGFEMHDVVPDIVVLGKPIGNGHPLSAVVTTKSIAEAFNNGMEFFSSFGGNPVSCRIGKSVLEVIEDEALQKGALVTGNFLKRELCKLQDIYSCLGDIRGEGLFLGIDIVKNREERIPDGVVAQQIVNDLKRNRILTSLDGPGINVIKVKPPLCFNQNDSERLISALELTLKRFF